MIQSANSCFRDSDSEQVWEYLTSPSWVVLCRSTGQQFDRRGISAHGDNRHQRHIKRDVIENQLERAVVDGETKGPHAVFQPTHVADNVDVISSVDEPVSAH